MFGLIRVQNADQLHSGVRVFMLNFLNESGAPCGSHTRKVNFFNSFLNFKKI